MNLLRDAALRLNLTEFHTSIRGNEQWAHLRELGQTEYTRRAVGILTYEQQRAVAAAFHDVTRADPVQGVTEDDALAAHARNLRARIDVPAAPPLGANP